MAARGPETRRQQDGLVDFGLFFFAADAGGDPAFYQMLLEACLRADEAGLTFVSVPERHYHSFGGPFPNPAIALGALAATTKRIELRFGSLISPLHNVIEVAESYSMLASLSAGRIGIAFGSGWHPHDFSLRPELFQSRKKLMFRQVDQLRVILRTGSTEISLDNGELRLLEVYPRTSFSDPPIWITSSGNPETFRTAGERGFNLLTHMENASHADLRDNISLYRTARQESGHDPVTGRVTVMLHTFVHDDPSEVSAAVKGLRSYFETAMDLEALSTRVTGKMSGGRLAKIETLNSEGRRKEIISLAIAKYLSGASLLGDVQSCSRVVHELAEIGVNEIACLVDFLSESQQILTGLDGLFRLAKLFSRSGLDIHSKKMVHRLMSDGDALDR